MLEGLGNLGIKGHMLAVWLKLYNQRSYHERWENEAFDRHVARLFEIISTIKGMNTVH